MHRVRRVRRADRAGPALPAVTSDHNDHQIAALTTFAAIQVGAALAAGWQDMEGVVLVALLLFPDLRGRAIILAARANADLNNCTEVPASRHNSGLLHRRAA